MKCPTDQNTLLITERHGIEIDYCPECRGVWLDRGELDKMIEQGSMGTVPSRPTEQHYVKQDEYRDDDRKFQQPHKKKRRESFLSDLFEFGD